MKTLHLLFVLPALTCALAPAADPGLTAEQTEFFEKKIRPVLADKCYKCHSEQAEKIKGGLVLDTRDGIRRGGDSGPAVVPGDLRESILIEAVRYTNKDFAMPPEKSGGKLPDAVIKDFEAWVKMGAPDPREGASKLAKKPDREAAKKWWAFQPPTMQPVPQPRNAAWAYGDIDRFLLNAMEGRNLAPVGDAESATLLRRIFFDLTGLPPSPKDVGEFLNEWKLASADAKGAKAAQQAVLARWADRLLASPRFGEKWGRNWLDVARYAESSGKDVNIAFPHAWRYRDYVIAAMNADKPFDQFVREQIAGDLLPSANDAQKAEQIVATGFLAVGPKGLNEQNARLFCLDLADEQIDAVSQAFVGMTIACARCHDHKFDPISQREYYAMAGIFLSTDTKYGTATNLQNRHASDLVELPAGAKTVGKPISAPEMERIRTKIDELRKEQQDLIAARIKSRMDGKGDDASQRDTRRGLQVLSQLGELEAQLKGHDGSGKQKPLAMAVTDLPATGGQAMRRGIGEFLRRGPQFRQGRPPEFSAITESPLYARGDHTKPGERVPRGVPAILSHSAASAIPKDQSGRAQLAEWLVSPGNPLTSRVIVNRAWHWLFGSGIVESVDNFGTTGKPPSNQALLDSLAVKFQTPVARGGHGWSMKKLIREMVLSHAYQLSSEYHPGNFAADPGNALVWRASKRRLDAESIRDAMLAACGRLQLDPPAGSFIARSGDAPIGGARFVAISEDQLVNSGGSFEYRSIYLPLARDVPPDALAVFDLGDASMVNGARDTTNVPAQALYILNSDFVAASAGNLAARVMDAYPGGGASANLDQRTGYAYWLTLGRSPTPAEKTAAWNFFQKFPANWSKGDTSAPGMKDAEDVKAAWTSFCRALFGTADFRFLN